MNTTQDTVDKLQALLDTVQRNRQRPRAPESARPERSRSLLPPGVRTESVRPDDALELDLAQELGAAPLGPPTEPAPHTFSTPPAPETELESAIQARTLSAPPPTATPDDEPLTRKTPIETAIPREATRISSAPPSPALPEAIAAPPPFASGAVATFVPPPEPAPLMFGDLIRRSRALRIARGA